MKNASKQIDRKTLKSLEPLNRLNPLLLDELAAKSMVDEVPAGRIVCRHGEKDSRLIYLLQGQIEIVTPGNPKTELVKAKNPLTKPLNEGKANRVTLKTKTASTLLYIDADLLELLMSDEPELTASAYEVTEISADEGDDWMLTFLQSPAFLQLPTENIQKLLTHMEEIQVKKDQVIIKQGDNDDNYYIVKSGSCNVHRQPHKDAANVLLAVLPTGSGFGEEALISNSHRNATITMREDGALMKLKKKDFLDLLITPILTYVDADELMGKTSPGSVVIDVRSEEQSKKTPIEGAVNIPLSMLRLKFDSLNADREYLLFCEDGSQSAAAAFLMIQNGFQCRILKGGLKALAKNSAPAEQKAATAAPANTTVNKTEQRAEKAKQQSRQIEQQQAQIRAAREKAEQEIQRRKKELEESRARIAQKKKQVSSLQKEASKLKEKATQELARAEAESKANAERQEKIAREAAAAELARKKAEEEAALIKQQAAEEAERIRAQKAAEALAKAEAERKAIEQRQKEIEKARQEAEQARKKAEKEAELARRQAEEEAERIRLQAQKEAEALRAEVGAERRRMQEEAERLKQEEQIVKNSALKMRNEADEIRRQAMQEAEQIRAEIESTRNALQEKLEQSKEEEKRKAEAILAEAKKQAEVIAASRTKEAAAEAEAIREKARLDALRLHEELEQTRKQIEEEATRVISSLKQQTAKKEAEIEQDVQVIEEEVLVEVVAEAETNSYKSVSIPGAAAVSLDDDEAQRKAERIKAKLAESASQKVKVHKSEDKVILEGEEDLFLFKEPEGKSAVAADENPFEDDFAIPEQPVVANRTRAEAELTQIEITPRQQEAPQQRSVVIYPQQEQGPTYKNNPFLKDTEDSSRSSAKAASISNFDREAYLQKRQGKKSNTMAIAASFLLILAGTVFTLHATNTLKVQSIAALFNSGNDQPVAIAVKKSKTKKVLRAQTANVNIKKKVDNKMDSIMKGWKEILEEQKNPKKAQQQ